MERGPDPDYGFSATEIDRFRQLLIIRGCDEDLADVLAERMLNSLAQHGTKTVLGLPDGDIVITVDEGSATVGRDLRTVGRDNRGQAQT